MDDSAVSSPLVSTEARNGAALREPRNYTRSWVTLLAFADALAFLLSAYLGTFFIDKTWDARHFEARLYSSAIFVALWILIFHRLGLYTRSFALSVRDEMYFVVVALTLGAVPQISLFTIAPQLSTSRSYIIVSLLFAMAVVSVTRASLHVVAQSRRRRAVRACIVLLSTDASSVSTSAFRDLGDVIVDRVASYDPSEILSTARRLGATAVMIADVLEPMDVQQLRAALATEKIRLLLAPPHLAAWDYDFGVRRLGDRIVLETRPLAVCTAGAQLTKRLMDIAIATVAIIISAPLMLAATIAILIDDGPPVRFVQLRVGKDGVPFRIIKFRTMRRNSEASYAAAVGRDPRITRAGAFLRRTSIDELPQFFNVLRGEMSVVGPRPEMLSYAFRYALTIPRYRERHQVRPGITCWGAVYMSRIVTEADARSVLAHDLFYIQHWSPLLDLTIVLKTAAEVLFHRHE